MTRLEKIAALYIAITGDATPTAEELDAYAGLADTTTLEFISTKMGIDSGASAVYAALPEADVVDQLFINLFGYTADEITALKATEAGAEGFAYWVDQLVNNSTLINENTIAIALLNGAGEADTASALAIATDLASEYEDYTPEDVVPSVPGSDFFLTSNTDAGYAGATGIDTTGTANDDNYYAYIQQNAFAGGVSNSLSSADQIDGGAGTDTLHAQLVEEFVGATDGANNDVQPNTADVEIATFEVIDDDMTVTVDAKNMTGVDSIGSKFSDGDLVIENLTTLTDAGEIRHTSDMTITMDHTDNMNSDEDASDLTVLFDEDYLNRTTDIEGSTLTINMINTLNLELNDGSSFVEGYDTVTFTVGETLITVDVAGAELDEVQGLIEAQLDAAGFDDVSVSTYTEDAYFGTNIYYETTDTTYNAGTYVGPYTAFILTNSGSEELIEGGFTLTDGQNDGSLAYSQNDTEADTVDLPISINVELEKVGRDGDGGNLIIGGKDQNSINQDEDKNDGIEQFDITVKGDEDQPSNLGFITSTNDFLETVNIESETRTDGSYASLTVRGTTEVAANGDDALVPATAPFGGTLTSLNANSFMGDLTIGEVTAAQNIDTFTATGGGDVTLTETIDGTENGVSYTVTTGAGADDITVSLDGDAVDAEGESFAVSTGAGADMVTVTDNDDTAATFDDVSDETTLALDNLSITTGTGADTVYVNTDLIFNVSTGTDSDFVVVDADNAVGTLAAAVQDDFDGTDNVGSLGRWSIGDGSDAAGTDWADRVLYEATVTVDFAGFTQTVTVETTAANNFVATQADINAAVIDAIETNEELARLLDTTIGTGTNSSQLLTITSTVQGVNDLTISVDQPTITAAAGAAATDTTIIASEYAALEAGLIATGVITSAAIPNNTEAEIIAVMNAATFTGNLNETGAVAAADFVLDAADGVDGTNNANVTDFESKAIIDLGTGSNDLVVLDSDADSADTLVFSAAFGKVSVVNFFDAQNNDSGGTDTANVTVIDHDNSDEVVGDHILDFTAFLDDQYTTSGSTASAIREATELTAADSVVAIDLTSNQVNILTDFTATATETFAGLTAAELETALNGTAGVDATDYANIDAVASALASIATSDALVGTSIDSILMIESDVNDGEYKVFNVETTDLGLATEAYDVSLVGTIDFGESIDTAVIGNFA